MPRSGTVLAQHDSAQQFFAQLSKYSRPLGSLVTISTGNLTQRCTSAKTAHINARQKTLAACHSAVDIAQGRQRRLAGLPQVQCHLYTRITFLLRQSLFTNVPVRLWIFAFSCITLAEKPHANAQAQRAWLILPLRANGLTSMLQEQSVQSTVKFTNEYRLCLTACRRIAGKQSTNVKLCRMARIEDGRFTFV